MTERLLDEWLDEYVNKLIANENSVIEKERRNLVGKRYFYELLSPINKYLKRNKDASIKELRDEAFDRLEMEKALKDLVDKYKLSSGVSAVIGIPSYEEVLAYGSKKEVRLSDGEIINSTSPLIGNEIYDIASITKLFTSLSIYLLLEQKKIYLHDDITYYLPGFKDLRGVTINDLLKFNVPLKTNSRVDSAGSSDDALKVLKTIHIKDASPYENPYTDMGAMVLKYLIEKVSGESYYEFLERNILSKLKMTNTYVNVPKDKLYDTVSTNLNYKVINGTLYRDSLVEDGVTFDPKARAMQQGNSSNLSGHAGLFVSNLDMGKLAKAIINNGIISRKTYYKMIETETGKYYLEGGKLKFTRYFGSLIYTKTPDSRINEVNHALSGISFSSPGFTGVKLTVDPLNEIYVFLGANKTHNRITAVSKEDGTLISNNGIYSYFNDQGKEVIDSRLYAQKRDDICFDKLVALALSYKYIEDLGKKLSHEDVKTKSKRKL